MVVLLVVILHKVLAILHVNDNVWMIFRIMACLHLGHPSTVQYARIIDIRYLVMMWCATTVVKDRLDPRD